MSGSRRNSARWIRASQWHSSRTPDGTYRAVAQHVRSQVPLAAKARELFALDSVFLDIPDIDDVRGEANAAAAVAVAVAVGFDGKVATHPTHITVIRDASHRLPTRSTGRKEFLTLRGRTAACSAWAAA